MAQRTRLLEMMRAGEPWKNITSSGSRSVVYQALTIYFGEAEEKYEKLRDSIEQLEGELAGRRGELQNIEARVTAGEHVLGELEERRSLLEEELKKIEDSLEEEQGRWDELNSKLTKLDQRGVTEEAIARIGQMDFGTGDELLTRLATHEAHEALQAATESLCKENFDLKAEYDETETRLQEIRREIDSQRNILDEAKRRTQVFNEAVEVVQSFFQEDYDTEILQGLKTALNNIAVKGQPKTSIKRLLEGLGNVRELAKLEAAIEGKKVELAKTEGELNNAKAVLKAVKDTTLQQIEDAKTKAILQLDRMNTEQTKMMENLYTAYEESLEKFRGAQDSQLETFRTRAETELSKIGAKWSQHIDEMRSNLDKSFLSYNKEVQKWGEIKQKVGAYEKMMQFGFILLGILDIPESIAEIPLDIITRLVYRIHLWTRQKMPDARTMPSSNVANIDSGFYRSSEYKLSALTLWLTEEFHRRLEGGMK